MRITHKHEPEFCSGCPLYRDKAHRTTYLPTEVHYSSLQEDGTTPQVDVLFIGETPGRLEDEFRVPLAGDVSREFKDAVTSAGLASSYAYANLVRCRPVGDDGNNRKPSIEEVAACSNYVRKDIQRYNPKVVVFMGNQPIQELATHPEWKGKGVGSLKGQIYRKDGKIHLATVHPSSFVRANNGPEKRRFRRHLSAAKLLLTGESSRWSAKGEVVLVNTIEKFDEVMKFFMTECDKPVAFDFETKNLNKVARNKIATLQLAGDPNLAYTIPVDHWQTPWTKEQRLYIKRKLRKLFASKKVKFPFWIAHNSQFDIAIAFKHLKFRRFGKLIMDTQFLAYLQDENQAGSDDNDAKSGFNAFRLKELAREHLSFYLYDTELSDALAARHGAKGGSLWDLPLDRLSEYGGTDAYVTFRLFYFYRKMLADQGYDTALKFGLRWFGRVTSLLSKMQTAGFKVDKDQLDFLLSDDSPILSRLDELPPLLYKSKEAKKANDAILGEDSRTKGMKPLFGKKPWVLDIDKRLHRINFFIDGCGLQPLAYGKDGKPSINKAFYEEYKEHPLVELYQEYSGLYKLRSSYLNSVDDILYSNPDNAADGRMHAGFHASRTVTGRLSSSNVNLQQLPKGDPWTAKAFIRSMYGARPGYILIECDYGQAEVRWWAQLAQDLQYAQLFIDMKKMRDEYRLTGDPDLGKRVKLECDIHKKVAALMFRKVISDVSKDDRKKAKSIVFGSIYGQHYKNLASILGIHPEEAKLLQETFVREFPKAGNWLIEIEEFAIRHGVVSTLMGRRRHLSDIIELDENAGRRRARNSPVQAISSDTTALAAWRIQEWIDTNKLPWFVINCVHDAITLEVPADYESVQSAVAVFHEMMVDGIPAFLKEEFGIDMILPMEIDFDLGVRWGHMLGYDGHEKNLPALVQQCKAWDEELSTGIPWHTIARREKCFQNPELLKAA